jgi:hypothetical protein
VAVAANGLFIAVDVSHFYTHGRAEDIDAARRDPKLTPRHFEINP